MDISAIPNRHSAPTGVNDEPFEQGYDWREDSYRSWLLALRMMALACGSIPPATVWERDWVKQHGVIP